ncbi:hypothetical protein BELL_0197g00080 [Botrytis elliptica]|uniref:Uncharacterized protein n=1 Tax=Botrytis elliptica TaxID=278938 RepID=A0A4Z1JPK9_9HELO|nr:hypothetical protein BELL_0197g00080 [Botrytis elliptica]
MANFGNISPECPENIADQERLLRLFHAIPPATNRGRGLQETTNLPGVAGLVTGTDKHHVTYSVLG